MGIAVYPISSASAGEPFYSYRLAKGDLNSSETASVNLPAGSYKLYLSTSDTTAYVTLVDSEYGTRIFTGSSNSTATPLQGTEGRIIYTSGITSITIGDSLAYNIDTLWDPVRTGTNGTSNNISRGFTYGSGETNPYLAYGTKTDSNNSAFNQYLAAYSTNGVSWTVVRIGGASVYGQPKIITHGGGLYFGGGYNPSSSAENGYFIWSTDGITWSTSQTWTNFGGTNAFPYDGVYEPTLARPYLLVGNNGGSSVAWASSTNGTSWTYNNTAIAGAAYQIASLSGSAVMVVGSANIYRTTNGSTMSSINVGNTTYCVHSANSLYMIGSYSGNIAYIATSTDGLTWGSWVDTGIRNQTPARIYYRDGHWVVYESNNTNTIYISTNATTWSSRSVNIRRGASISQGKIVSIGTSSMVYFADDYEFITTSNILGLQTQDTIVRLEGPYNATTI